MRICLFIEGSYPFITGGVSAWVQELLQGLADIEFILYTISPKSGQSIRYTLPPNVVGHKDIVISEKQRSRYRFPAKRKFFSMISKFHESLTKQGVPDVQALIRHLPEQHFLYDDAVREKAGWELIRDMNQRHNPAFAFADYFWTWKSSHDMMFSMISSEVIDADVYHAVSTGYAGLAAVVASMRTGKPLVLTEHGLYHKEREMEIKRARFVKGYQRDIWINIYNSIARICYKYADVVISLFEYNRRRQIELGADSANAIVIPNGINIERFSRIVREKRAGFHVGFVGRVVPIKDVKTFIQAAHIISELISEARFYIIGPVDEDKVYYEDCIRLVKSFRLEDRVEFTGKKDVRDYYSFLDVLMLTSIREAQPLVVLEAFCAGIPVVSTKVGNVLELLDFDERFLSSPKDPEKLARNVYDVYKHPEALEALVARNKGIVNQFYNRDQVHAKYRDLYKELKERN